MVMVFGSSFSKNEIEILTYREAFKYVKYYYHYEAEKLLDYFKTFGIFNLESTGLAMHGKKGEIISYLRKIQRREISYTEEENQEHIADQFKGVDFG